MAVSVIGQNPLYGFSTNSLSGDILGQRIYGSPLDSLNSGASIFGGFDPVTSQLAAQFGGAGCGSFGNFGGMMNPMMMGMGGMMNPMMGGMMNPMMMGMGMFGMDPSILKMSPAQRQRYFSRMMIDQERCNNEYDLERAKLNALKTRDLKGLNFLAQSRPQAVDRYLQILDRQITNNEQEKIMGAFAKALSALQDEYRDMGLDVNMLAQEQKCSREDYLKSELLRRYEAKFGANIENRIQQYGDSAFIFGLKRSLTFGYSNNRMSSENIRDILGDSQIDKGEKPKAIAGRVAGGLLSAGLLFATAPAWAIAWPLGLLVGAAGLCGAASTAKSVVSPR